MTVDRRALLHWMVVTGGLAALNRLSAPDLLAMGREAHAGAPHADRDLQMLGTRAAQQVTIAAEMILPASDTPGATDAGVTAFVDTMLARWYPPADRDRFLAGLRELDVRATAVHGSAFVDCPADAKHALLAGFDADVVALRDAGNALANDHWFAMLKYLTVWGYCTSERGMRDTLRTLPMPTRYDGNAPVAP